MNTVNKICSIIDEREALDMLQEECAELIKAASKIKRVMNGDCSVDSRKARLNLIEELGDVNNMIMLTQAVVLEREEIMEVCTGGAAKLQRYYDRLKEREQHGTKMDD